MKTKRQQHAALEKRTARLAKEQAQGEDRAAEIAEAKRDFAALTKATTSDAWDNALPRGTDIPPA